MKKEEYTDPALVYYGPHPCKDTQTRRKRGNKGCKALIVKAGNGAPARFEFDAQPQEGLIYPTTHPHLRWRQHKCTKLSA